LIINIIIAPTNNDVSIATFSTLLNDAIFNIAIDILQTKGANEMVIVVQKEEGISGNAGK
jgi:hypothetical protein